MSDFGFGIARLSSREQVSKLAKGRPDVQQAKPGHCAARVVAPQQRAENRRELSEIITIPERRPGDQHQEQPGFEQQGDEQQPSEQKLASGLDFREPLNLSGDIAVTAGLCFELDEHRERPRLLAHRFQGLGQIV